MERSCLFLSPQVTGGVYTNFCGKLHTPVHREQSGTFTRLTWKPKPTACDESASPDSLPALTVTVAFVVLVLGDQPVQLWIAVFLWYTTADPVLDKLEYDVVVISSRYGGIFYPQQYVIVWSTTILVLLLLKVLCDNSKCCYLEKHCVKEVVEFL